MHYFLDVFVFIIERPDLGVTLALGVFVFDLGVAAPLGVFDIDLNGCCSNFFGLLLADSAFFSFGHLCTPGSGVMSFVFNFIENVGLVSRCDILSTLDLGRTLNATRWLVIMGLGEGGGSNGGLLGVSLPHNENVSLASRLARSLSLS